MKQKPFILFFLALLLSCSDSNQKLLPNSSGNINNISVVSSDDIWEGKVGEVIRENFARPIYGLPQIEPVFSLSHIPSKIFTGFATKSRTILKIDISETEGVFNFKNTYASPQRIIQVTGSTPEKIITTINQNMNAIYSALYFNEIQEKQRRISKNLNQTRAAKRKERATLERALVGGTFSALRENSAKVAIWMKSFTTPAPHTDPSQWSPGGHVTTERSEAGASRLTHTF